MPSGELRLLVYSAASPAEDLALEESLHLGLERDLSPPTWRLWESGAHALVLGAGQQYAKEAHFASGPGVAPGTASGGVPILRRHSGGGAVLVGPGILQYSCFFRFAETPGAQTIRGAMAAALHPLQTALRTWSIFAQPAGLSDLAVLAPDGALRKLAGNAQARKRRSGVVHGALLADPDWALLEQVLRFPTRAPDYRAGRGHRDFLISLRDLRAPCDLGSLVEALSAALGAKAGRNVAPREEELARARELLEEKYSRPEWNLRR